MRFSTLLTLLLTCVTLAWTQTNYLVETSGLTFSPNSLVIEVGDTVTWRNSGGGNHNVNGSLAAYPDNPEGFSSGSPSSAVWTFQHVFTLPGTYAYQCDPHVAFNMVGTVTVNDNSSGTGNIVITEISYNPPESGQDIYEFIELYNNGDQAVNLLNYAFTSGVEHTFTSGVSLAAGDYLIVAEDGVAFEAAFGVPAVTWTDGGLSNGGEAIALRDADGMLVDSVDYDDGGVWPAAADGAGATLVLCDFDADNNDGSNWAAANTPTGFFSGGVEIFANPGATSSCVSGATVRFLETEVEVNEDAGTVVVQVAFSDLVDQAYSVDILTNDPGTTATVGVDVTVSPVNLAFTAMGETMQVLDVTITVTDDMEMELREDLVLTLTSPSAGLSIDPFGATTTITILDNDTTVPELVISEIMYNPPGTDTEGEYLEIHNPGNSAVNLAGFYFEQGIEFTFPDISIAAGGYLALTVDSLTFQERYGTAAWEWTSGALGNGGETLELRDASGNVVDEVTYDEAGDWPTEPDGDGPALVLCDLSADNSLAASWSAAVQPTGVFVSGTEILGSPGAVNDCTPPMPPSYPPYAIGLVTTNDANGVPDSINRRAELTGVVYGVNLRPGGLLFTMIGSDNEGIAVFSGSDNFGYTVTEGDEITVRGIVSQFNGVTQLNTDTLAFNNSNNPLVDPTLISVLDESTESQLVQLNGMTIMGSTSAGNGLNVTLVDTEDNELTMRIDFNTNITEDFINGLTGQLLQVTGIGTQFDPSEPHTEGYQIAPRYTEDITVVDRVAEPAWAATTQVFPQPARTEVQIRATVALEAVTVYDALGQFQFRQLIGAPQYQLDLSRLPAGTYLLALEYGADRLVRRIVKL